jgi:hypothetical protein
MHLYNSFDKWRGYLYADAGDVFVILSLNGGYTAFLANRQSQYGGKKYRLTIKAGETKQLTEEGRYIGPVSAGDMIDRKRGGLGFDEYSGNGFKMLPGGLSGSPKRIQIPFSISGSVFLVDVVVKTTRDGYWDMDDGPPSMP